jgi:hypothetical protein
VVLVPIGPFIPPSSPPPVTATFRLHRNTSAGTGVDEVDAFRSNDPGDDQFDYKIPLLQFIPAGARVTSVTNVSTDVDGNGVKLTLVRHADAFGVQASVGPSGCQPAALEPQFSTPGFNGLTVQGEWKVRVGCTNQVFWNNPPARIALRVAWSL